MRDRDLFKRVVGQRRKRRGRKVVQHARRQRVGGLPAILRCEESVPLLPPLYYQRLPGGFPQRIPPKDYPKDPREDPQEDLPKGPPRGPPGGSCGGSPRESPNKIPRGSSKGFLRGSPSRSPEGSPRASPRRSPRGIPPAPPQGDPLGDSPNEKTRWIQATEPETMLDRSDSSSCVDLVPYTSEVDGRKLSYGPLRV